MTHKEGYIPKADRKTILFLSDDCRLPSGVGTMTRELVLGNAHRYNFILLGAAVNHPELGKIMDLSQSIDQELGLEDASVFLYPYNGYGDASMLSNILATHPIDVIAHFTDPRYYGWLYKISAEIRQHIPIVYYHIWDNLPAPHYNKPYYESCDLLIGISKQSVNVSEMVLGEGGYVKLNGKTPSKLIASSIPKTCYVPHGVNHRVFTPLEKTDEAVKAMRAQLFGEADPEFVLLYNNRNIMRKATSDLIIAFKLFVRRLEQDQRQKVRLVMHTNPIDENGTNLPEVIDTLAPEVAHLIKFTNAQFSSAEMNVLYNSCDVGVNISSSEGWGLSCTEAIMAGRMVISNVTGGLQDQMRFTDEKGKWIEFTSEFASNHTGTYQDHGDWVIPVFPATINLQGSLATPYIFDDRCHIEDVAIAMRQAFSLEPDKRAALGLKGREWMVGDEAKMTADHMSKSFGDAINTLLQNWVAIERFKVYSVSKELTKRVNRPTGIML